MSSSDSGSSTMPGTAPPGRQQRSQGPPCGDDEGGDSFKFVLNQPGRHGFFLDIYIYVFLVLYIHVLRHATVFMLVWLTCLLGNMICVYVCTIAHVYVDVRWAVYCVTIMKNRMPMLHISLGYTLRFKLWVLLAYGVELRAYANGEKGKPEEDS